MAENNEKPDPHEVARSHFEHLRDLHAEKAEERHNRALNVFLAGGALIVAAFTAAEYIGDQGSQPNLRLHWLIPFLVVALLALDTRFRVFSGRAEELNSDVYAKQVEWLIPSPTEPGRHVELNRALRDFRDREVQYYANREDTRIWWTTRVIQGMGYLPFGLVTLWSVASVLTSRAPRPGLVPWLAPKLFGFALDVSLWLVAVIVVFVVWAWCTIYRGRRVHRARTFLRGMPP